MDHLAQVQKKLEDQSSIQVRELTSEKDVAVRERENERKTLERERRESQGTLKDREDQLKVIRAQLDSAKSFELRCVKLEVYFGISHV